MPNYPTGSNVQVSYSDDAIVSENPGFGYGGSEASALWFEDREINGVLYRVQNATWNKFSQSWILIDATKPAYGFAFTNGVIQTLYSPANTTPFTSWQTSDNIGGLTGVKTGVPADGSAAASVTLTPGFANTITAVVLSIGANYSGNDNAALSVRLNAVPTKTGFSVMVVGGQSGSTVDVHYQVFGS